MKKLLSLIMACLLVSLCGYGQIVSGSKDVKGGGKYSYSFYNSSSGGAYGQSYSVTVKNGQGPNSIFLGSGQYTVNFSVTWDNIDDSGSISVSGNVSGKLSGIKITKQCHETNITNQNITSNKTYNNCIINITNTTIYNNATVSITADNGVIVKPATYFKEGTNVIIKTSDINTYSLGSVRSAPIEEVFSIEEAVVAIGSNTKFYPNPTDGILNFECLDTEAGCSVRIYSISGQLVYSNGVQRNGDIIDLSSVAKGMYLAKVTVDGETITQKIILK